ncbi:hypothetical protein [Streptomyces sp. NPDC005374]|uniref:hypothetical protein n=1 Tax=Streptomyces sp. NPDC005374 TaxID=3364713 RepID=UPI00367F2925
MSITPQMGQQGQQQLQPVPSTSPHDQQPFGQQGFGQQQDFGRQQDFGQQQGGIGSMEQLQQLGRQQPFQQLLHQLGGLQQGYGQQQQQPYGQSQQQDQQAQQTEQQNQQQLQQLAQSVVQQVIQQVQSQALAAGAADGFIDIVHPLQGQPQQVFLRINNQFRVLNSPSPQIHQQIQEAFAFGHQVIGIWDTQSPNVLRSVRIQRV